MGFMQALGDTTVQTLDNLQALVAGSGVGETGVDELRQISDLVVAQGYETDRIMLDPSVVRGLGYYTGPVYEAELTFKIKDEKGADYFRTYPSKDELMGDNLRPTYDDLVNTPNMGKGAESQKQVSNNTQNLKGTV